MHYEIKIHNTRKKRTIYEKGNKRNYTTVKINLFCRCEVYKLKILSQLNKKCMAQSIINWIILVSQLSCQPNQMPATNKGTVPHQKKIQRSRPREEAILIRLTE